SGEEEFIASAASVQQPPEWAEEAEEVTLLAPSAAFAGRTVEIAVKGPAETGYWLGFAPTGSENNGQSENPYSSKVLSIDGEQLAELTTPTIPGEYELRYRE